MTSNRRKQLQPRHIAQDHRLLTEALENEVSTEYSRIPLRSFDNHICGRCSAEFFTMPAFLMHKKRCANEWPVLVSTPSSVVVITTTTTTTMETEAYCSDENDADKMNRDENKADKSFDLCEKSCDPIADVVDENANKMNDKEIICPKLSSSGYDSGTGVARIQTALVSLQRQQILQLQLIKHIYGQLLKSTKSASIANDDDGDSFEMVNENDERKNLFNDKTKFIVDSFKVNVLSSSKQLKRNVAQQLIERRKSMERLFAARCQLCDKDVGNLKRLDNHMKSVHGMELQHMSHTCYDCYECFKSHEELDDHMKSHEELDDRMKLENRKKIKRVSAPEKENEICRSVNFQNERILLSTPNDTVADEQNGCNQIVQQIDAEQTSPLDRCTLTNLNLHEHSDDIMKNDTVSPTWHQQDFYGSDLSTAGSFLGTPVGPSSRCTPMDFESPTMVNLIKNNHNSENNGINFVNISTPCLTTEEEMMNDKRSPESFHDGINAKLSFDDDDDWEDLMEVANMDEASEIRQLAGDAATTTTDRNECIICHKILSCKSALQMHYRTHTGTRPFKCKVCQRAFTTKGNLKTHMSVHKTKSSSRLFYHCPVCQKAFINSSCLHEHLSVHHNGAAQPPVDSIIPTTVFLPTSTSSATRYPTCTSGIQPSDCLVKNGNEFGLKFDNSMKSPTMKHVVESARHETICNICFEKFPNADTLEVHMSSHRRKKPYKCEDCGRGFSTRGNLKQHRDSIHFSSTPGTPNGNEPQPNYDFQTQNGDRLSTRSHSEPDNQMNDKHANLPSMGHSINGTSRHNSITDDVTMTSSSSSYNRTLCHICMKQCCSPSILQIHMRSHTGDRPFVCNVCTRSFSTKGNLKAHMEIHTYASETIRGRRYFSAVTPTKNLNKNADTFKISRRSNKNVAIVEPQQSQLKQSSVFPTCSFNPIMHNNFHNSLSFLPHNQPFYDAAMMQPISADSINMFRPEFSMGNLQPNFNHHQHLMMNGFNNNSSSSIGVDHVGGYHSGKSVEMFSVVCSLCHKVCSSTSELENHLKTHLCQTSVNVHNVLKA